ncbi:MAG: MBL fold metallo-hydrolase [Pseudomonadota bacterium]|nr:MBL fold metallo-hydrolase [Pseudomonadota bacterium]
MLHAGLLLLGTVAMAAAPADPSGPLPTPADVMRLHFIDVGQGAATLVELPCGAMLIDAGGEDGGEFHSNDRLAAYLAAFFARRTDLSNRLDVLLLTHPHIDHVRGALPTLEAYTVGAFVDNGQTPVQEDAALAMVAVRAWLDAHPTVPTLVVTTDDLPADGAPLRHPSLDPFGVCRGVDPAVGVLWGHAPHDPGWGEDDYNKARYDNENNHSVVTRIDFGAASVLITGDLEEVAIRDLVSSPAAAALDVDIYVVGHHGSHNGTTRDLLAAMTPAWAVLQMGPAARHGAWTAWQYGHPRQPTIALLAEEVSSPREPVTHLVGIGVKRFADTIIDDAIYATGWDGTVVIEADAAGIIRLGAPDVR